MARRHDALVPLSHDHQQALALAFRLHHPAPPGPVTPTTPASTRSSRRSETLAFFSDHLLRHFAIEEDVLFPVLDSAHAPGTRERALIDTLRGEHRRLEQLRDAVEQASSDEAIDHALGEFAGLLERHVRLEERGLFAHFPGALAQPVVAELQREIRQHRPPDVPGACKI